MTAKSTIETFAAFKTCLQQMPADAPMVFASKDHVAKGGYHVTELKIATIKGIDCGGKITEGSEASLQIMDGFGGPYMTVGKFLGLLGHSLNAMPELAGEAAFVDFAPMNVGLRAYQIGSVSLDEGRVTVQLVERGPWCKAAERVAVLEAAVIAARTCFGIALPRCC